MKKYKALLLTILMIFLGIINNAYASCGTSIKVGEEYLCFATNEKNSDGTVYEENGFLVLNNYNGGAIKITSGISEVSPTIKLIGDNYITSDDFGISTIGTYIYFAGDGTLTIKAKKNIVYTKFVYPDNIEKYVGYELENMYGDFPEIYTTKIFGMDFGSDLPERNKVTDIYIYGIDNLKKIESTVITNNDCDDNTVLNENTTTEETPKEDVIETNDKEEQSTDKKESESSSQDFSMFYILVIIISLLTIGIVLLSMLIITSVKYRKLKNQ